MITIWLFSEFAQSSLYNTQNLYFCLSDWKATVRVKIWRVLSKYIQKKCQLPFPQFSLFTHNLTPPIVLLK